MEVLLFTVVYPKQKQTCLRLVGRVLFHSENELHLQGPNSDVSSHLLGSEQSSRWVKPMDHQEKAPSKGWARPGTHAGKGMVKGRL